MKLRVLENFAGIGTQRMALENIGIEHEIVGITEIDKFAIKSYEAIHGKVNNLGDISLIDPNDVPDHDLFTYSFPCQDISVAGKGKGFEKGSGTRSGLLWECEKVIRAKKPKYLLMENVKNLVSKKFKPGFEEWLQSLEELGYTNYWQVLNAKDFGIPQNRERVFVVSILGEHEPYEFPKPIPLELRLKDILEHEVDEKFYLSKEKVDKLIINSNTSAIGYIPRTQGTQHQSNTVYGTDAESPSMQARDYKDPVKVLIKNATKKGYLEATHGDGVDLAYPDSKTRRGRVQSGLSQTLDTGDSKGVVIGASRGRNPENPSDRTVGSPTEQRLEINKQGTSNAITTVQKDNYVVEHNVLTPKRTEYGKAIRKDYEKGLIKESRHNMTEMWPRTDGVSNTLTTVLKDNYVVEPLETLAAHNNYRIRKLTPKECWRLMGCTDEDFHKAEQVNSNSQLYKQAGNAIVVDVLEAIFTNMFK